MTANLRSPFSFHFQFFLDIDKSCIVFQSINQTLSPSIYQSLCLSLYLFLHLAIVPFVYISTLPTIGWRCTVCFSAIYFPLRTIKVKFPANWVFLWLYCSYTKFHIFKFYIFLYLYTTTLGALWRHLFNFLPKILAKIE